MHSHNSFSEFLRGNDGGWIQTLGNKFQVSSGEVTQLGPEQKSGRSLLETGDFRWITVY